MIKGYKLEFSVYGTSITGEYQESTSDGTITIKVECDSSGVSKPGDIVKLHRLFLIKKGE